VLFKTVIIGSGLPTPTATPTTSPTTTATTTVPTTTQTTVTTTTTTTEATTTTTTQPAADQTTATTTTQPGANQTETGTTTTTTQPGTTQNPSYFITATTVPATAVPSKTFYSADRKVSLTTYGVDYAGLLMVRASAIPENWLALTEAYTIAPDSLAFSPAATISFTIPKAPDPNANYAYFIGRYANNQWFIVPSTAGTTTIEGIIDLAGTYSLMAFRPESTIPVPTTQKPGKTGTATETATETITPKGTPKIASIAQEATPVPAATKTPLGMVPVFCALGISAVIVMREAKRQK